MSEPAPLVSVIIPNHDRVAELGRALKALKFQTFRDFEVIVVSNQTAVVADRFSEIADAHLVSFQEANISAARNAGIAQAQGEVIAFLDDDAVPEATWLARLIAPFDDPKIGAVGGVVRGRNGVSFQWGPQEVDCFGNDWPLAFDGDRISDPSEPHRVLKTVGTNCAFRAEALREVGFDTAYRFYLDETDLNWRLVEKGWSAVIVSDAEVHHGYAGSSYRTSERVPKSFKEIGASKAYFCKRFGDPARVPEELDGFRRDQRTRLIRSMELGLLPPSEVSGLIDSLEEGFVEGAQRVPQLRNLQKSVREFKRYCGQEEMTAPVLLTTTLLKRRQTHELARRTCDETHPVTVFDFSYTALMLTVRFTDDGYWLHRGGIFGRGVRKGPLFRCTNLMQRTKKEAIRIALQRDLGVTFDMS